MTEAPPMGKKKGRKPPKTIGLNIKADEEWIVWVRELAEVCGMSMSGVVDHALRQLAKRQGFDKPAPKR